MRYLFLIFFMIFSLDASVYISDDKKIKNTLLKYNYGIIKMAKSGETDFFKTFVKKEVVTKLMLWVKSWQDSNLVMIAQINDFRFSPIIYNENNATMTTLENWTFSYLDLNTKKMAMEQPVNMLYKMRYTLQKHPHGWMIVDIKHLEEKQMSGHKTHKPSLDKKEKPKDDAH